MTSESVSQSASDACCIPSTCACDDWLTLFCDYQTVTLTSCDVETVFEKARSNGIKMEAINPQAGVHAADRVFRLSMQENDVEVSLGAVITDEDGTEWVVYAKEYLRSFCVWKLWTRSVETCFQLSEWVEVFEQDCSCENDNCGTTIQYKRVARVRGKVYAESGGLRGRNDSQDLVYRFRADLVRWPLSGRPGAKHRLKVGSETFRIVGVADGGQYVPFRVELEVDSADCSAR